MVRNDCRTCEPCGWVLTSQVLVVRAQQRLNFRIEISLIPRLLIGKHLWNCLSQDALQLIRESLNLRAQVLPNCHDMQQAPLYDILKDIFEFIAHSSYTCRNRTAMAMKQVMDSGDYFSIAFPSSPVQHFR